MIVEGCDSGSTGGGGRARVVVGCGGATAWVASIASDAGVDGSSTAGGFGEEAVIP